MKKEWIYNLNKINQQHGDASDYEMFYTYCLKYVKKNTGENGELYKVLEDCIKIFDNDCLLSIVYRLLSHMDCKIVIDDEILKKHIRKDNLKNYVLLILHKIDYKIIRKSVKRMVFDPGYFPKEIFAFFMNNNKWLKRLLVKRDSALIRKQMLVMINTKMFYSLEYFYQFFGSEQKNISFLSYELFLVFVNVLRESIDISGGDSGIKDGMEMLLRSKFQKDVSSNIGYVKETTESLKNVENIEPVKPKLSDSIINSGLDGFKFDFYNDEIFLKPIEKIKMRNISNFLVNFLPFMREKYEIHDLIKIKDITSITKILCEYGHFDDELVIYDKASLYSVSQIIKEKRNISFNEDEVNFEYLFNKNQCKTFLECVEF